MSRVQLPKQVEISSRHVVNIADKTKCLGPPWYKKVSPEWTAPFLSLLATHPRGKTCIGSWPPSTDQTPGTYEAIESVTFLPRFCLCLREDQQLGAAAALYPVLNVVGALGAFVVHVVRAAPDPTKHYSVSTRDHALAFHGLVVHSERRPNAPNFFPPRIVCCAPIQLFPKPRAQSSPFPRRVASARLNPIVAA